MSSRFDESQASPGVYISSFRHPQTGKYYKRHKMINPPSGVKLVTDAENHAKKSKTVLENFWTVAHPQPDGKSPLGLLI
ncbi:hypothetical protein ACTXT7_000723 [Hymenolepis weldensis]